ncbi:MAG TPA: glycine-rich protein, partial [Solirubrobacteraceae bacterium]|nr:glycine-rich protein [Solirubrobacteraceae bacterium]
MQLLCLIGACASLGLLAPAPASAGTTSVTFHHTGAQQTFTVPAGVTSLSVVAIGAPGGDGVNGYGTAPDPGTGARVAGTIAVTPGQTLYVLVGGPGSGALGGFNGGGNGGSGYTSGGGGGGASDVRTCSVATCALSAQDTRLVVAAGGGGSGAPTWDGVGAGGDAGSAGGGAPFADSNGGHGG